MASIRRRGTKWQVQVRRLGFPPITKTFSSRADALVWGRDRECLIDTGELPLSSRAAKALTVGDLLRRYQESVTPLKRGAGPENCRLGAMLGRKLAGVTLAKLSPATIAAYRDERLGKVKGASVRRELAILQHCFSLARREWGYPIGSNPVEQISIPSPGACRARRLAHDEAEKLTTALKGSSAAYLAPLITLAIETGLRRGELLSIVWDDVDLAACTIRVRATKNGHPRTIPMTPLAKHVLTALPRSQDRVFAVSGNAVRLAWVRLRARAGLPDLRLHDLRHEAVSRFFELGLSTPEVALISGHRDPRMLARYTHLRPEAIALKLRSLLADGS